MLAHVSMMRCFKSLVTAAGVADRCLYNVHTFLHQSANSIVNRTVWRTQIWTHKSPVFPAEGAGLFHEHRMTSERVISVAAT